MRGQLKWHSAWQEESQTHCEKGSFSGIPLLLSPLTITSFWNQDEPWCTLPGWAQPEQPTGRSALLLCFPGETPKRLVGTRCLVFAGQSQRKKKVTLLACLRMWLLSWFFSCWGWENTVSWGKVWEWSWGAQWGAVTLGSYHGAARGIPLCSWRNCWGQDLDQVLVPMALQQQG